MDRQDIQQRLVDAQRAAQRGDGTAAAKLFQSVLADDPENPHAHNSLGMQAMADNRLADAEAHFARAAAADPKEPALWLNVAKAQRLRGDDEGELASLNRALAADQRHFMSLLRKAELHERRGERGAAAQAWQGVVLLAGQAQDLPAALTPSIDHGRSYLAAHSADLAAAIETGLGNARDGLSQRERRRFDACLDAMLGRRRIYTNECHGTLFPFLPADEFFDREHFDWMPALEAKTDVIRDEFRALVALPDAPLRPYVAQDAGTPTNKWTALDHQLDWGAMFLEEYGVANTDAQRRCPATMASLNAIPRFDAPGRGPTIFFSLLQPRTRIPAHTGVSNLRAIIHLPLVVPDGCRFRVGGETRSWREGEAFAFDDTIEHEAWNDSDDLRAILIFDVWNPHLTEAERRLVSLMYATGDASGLGPGQERGAGY